MGATATVKGGFWPEVGVTSLTQVQGTSAGRRVIARKFSDYGLIVARTLAERLTGAAVGGATAKNLKRVEANVELGGKRTIESYTIINRVTTAADETELDTEFFAGLSSRTTMASPANKDGNPLGTR